HHAARVLRGRECASRRSLPAGALGARAAAERRRACARGLGVQPAGARGGGALARLRNVAELALGVSEFNRQELEGAGFRRTGVLPILVDWEQYAQPRVPALEEVHRSGIAL